jgi:hypothetical protein
MCKKNVKRIAARIVESKSNLESVRYWSSNPSPTKYLSSKVQFRSAITPERRSQSKISVEAISSSRRLYKLLRSHPRPVNSLPSHHVLSRFGNFVAGDFTQYWPQNECRLCSRTGITASHRLLQARISFLTRRDETFSEYRVRHHNIKLSCLFAMM